MWRIMRGSAALMLGALLLVGCAAQRTATPESMRHEARYTYDGISDARIFSAVRAWVLQHCSWDGDILQFEDAQQHTLMARGSWERATEYAPMIEVDIEYTLSVDIEKGEVYYELSRLAAMAPEDGEEMTFFSNSEKFHDDAEKRFQSMLTALDAEVQAQK
ncbi:MAG: DUF4468 domain-containing protein [Bacteroidota bacterium]|nr:DUF4468 domain-containing protein [Bacteroidota bacterium]